MIKLNSSRVLEAVLAGAVATTQPAAAVGYNDKDAAGFDGDSQLADLNGAAAVTICDAPAAGAIRHIDYLTIRNYDSAQVVVTVRVNEGGTLHNLVDATLETGEMLGFTHSSGWYVNTADGSRKSGAMQDLSGYQLRSEKDTEDGYPGLAGWAHKLHNALGTIVSLITSSSTAIRTYTFPDKSITVAGTDDVDAAQAAAQAYADSLVIGLVDDRGNFDASGNTFPSTGGSGAAGAILKGDLWTINVAGTLGGHAVTAGDLVRALVDAPGSTDSNWAITENNIGYVPLADTAAAVATRLHAATLKSAIVDADEVNGTDSANSFSLIRTVWSDVRAYLASKAWTWLAAHIFSDQQVSRAMLIDCGATFVDKGNSGTTTQTLDYTAGSHQKITATGNHTIATSNWPPTGNLGAILLEAVNFGAFTETWPTINWVKPDGTSTTSISTWLAASTGRTAFQTAGTDFLKIWSRDAGSTIYGGWAA